MVAGLGCGSAQLISIGVKGGVPLTQGMSGPADESRRYLVGGSIEFRLPARFAVEADVFYQHIGRSAFFAPVSILSSTNLVNLYPGLITYRQRGDSFEFPILGKYYLRSRESKWQPFVATGYAFRTIRFSTDSTVSDGTTTTAIHSSYRSSLGVGAVAAAGIRLRAGRFALVPELRYTRWGGLDSGSVRKNEAAFLFGITF